MNIIQRFKYGVAAGPYSDRSLYSSYQALKLKDTYELDHFKGWTKYQIRLYYVNFLVPIMKKNIQNNNASIKPTLQDMKGRALAIGTLQFAVCYVIGYMPCLCLIAYFFIKYIIFGAPL